MPSPTPSTGRNGAAKKAPAKKAAAKSASGAKKAPAKRASRKSPEDMNAVEYLQHQHREVEQLFEAFEKGDDEKKREIAEQICTMLKVHTQIEEEIFYPQARDATEEDDLVDEAEVEHDSAKQLIAEIEEMEPGDDKFDAKVKVLKEMIEHHVEEEEKELFPKCKKSDMDLAAIGEDLRDRNDALMAEMETSH